MRISERDLQVKVERLNIEAKAPMTHSTIGHYQLSCGYGGYSLHRVANERGAIVDVFNCGHIKGRELFQMLDAFILGIHIGRNGPLN